MKTLRMFAVFALAAVCAIGADTLELDNINASYLNKAELEAVIVKLQAFRYPATRAEVVGTLALDNRRLPSLRTTSGNEDRELINLTNPQKAGRTYRLFLWYDRSARDLSGEVFIKAKVITCVEMVVEDDGTADAPKGIFILQSSRYPYAQLEHPDASSMPAETKKR